MNLIPNTEIDIHESDIFVGKYCWMARLKGRTEYVMIDSRFSLTRLFDLMDNYRFLRPDKFVDHSRTKYLK